MIISPISGYQERLLHPGPDIGEVHSVRYKNGSSASACDSGQGKCAACGWTQAIEEEQQKQAKYEKKN